MVGRKRVKFGVEIYVCGMDPDICAGRFRHVYIRMDLSHGDGQRVTSVDDRVFAEEDRLRMGEALRGALGRRRRFGLRGIVHAEGFRSLWIDFTIICRTPVHPEDEVTSVSGEPY